MDRLQSGRIEQNAAWSLWDQTATDAIAIIEGANEVTYAQLQARASAFAAALGLRGVGVGDRVVIAAERSSGAAAAYYGVLASGAVPVVLNEGLKPRQIENAIEDCEASLFVYSRELAARQPRPVSTAAAQVELEQVEPVPATQPVPVGPQAPAQIIYTSGSSGLPKGVLLSHGNLAANVRIVSGYLGLQATDVTASLLPFSSVYGLNQLLCAVATGGTLLIERSPLPNAIAASLRKHGATTLAAVPPLWLQLLNAPEFCRAPIESLRILQSAGGYLPVPAVRALRAAQPHAKLFIQYGMTELMRSTFLAPDQVDARPDSMGRPIAESTIRVLRPDGSECAVDEPGELVHSGPTVAGGYWNNAEATRATFRPTAQGMIEVHSGDIVRRDVEGFLYFISRRDRLIKTLGYRVGPDEIVDALLASGLITEAVITTEPDPHRGERIIAHVVLKPGAEVNSLAQFAKVEMPRWLQPARFATYPALPRLPNGKYDLQQMSGVTIRPDAAAK